jgi:MFS transporter, ACS family, DAL5 transporter family protein
MESGSAIAGEKPSGSAIAVEETSGSVSVAAASPTTKETSTVDTFSSAEYRKLIWKLDVRLLPPLFVLWFISLIDRVNIGTARIQGLEKDLKMNPLGTQFNVATGMRFDKESQ